MKRVIFLLVLGLFWGGSLASAQDSKLFVKSVQIVTVATAKEGIKIGYLVHGDTMAFMYLPNSWFFKSGDRGEIVYGTETTYPYFSIYWRDGKFDHIRIFLRKDLSHDSYVPIDNSEPGLSDKFKAGAIPTDF